MASQELKNKLNDILFENGFQKVGDDYKNDYIYQILFNDDTKDVEDYHSRIDIEVKPSFMLYNNPTVEELYQYDDFYLAYELNMNNYWLDKIKLATIYTNKVEGEKSPMQLYNEMNQLVNRILKRVLIMKMEYFFGKQKNNDNEYPFIRSYWIDQHGTKDRRIHFSLTKINEQRQYQIESMFHARGYIVNQTSKQYDTNNAVNTFSLLIQRLGDKRIVKIQNDDKTYYSLFILNELLKKFKTDYPDS